MRRHNHPTSPVSPTKSIATWTSRDEEILEALALKCRVLTYGQIASYWWPAGSDRARKRLRQLCQASLLSRFRVMAHPVLKLSRPVAVWSPLAPRDVNCERVSYRLRARWTKASQLLTVYTATQKTAQLFGRLGHFQDLPKVLEMTHDIHVGEVYLHYLRRRPQQARDWVGEDVLGKAGEGQKDPDALLLDPNGASYLACEFGGRYDAYRVAAFHGHCSRHEIAYEIW